jgi:hypothetical protein
VDIREVAHGDTGVVRPNDSGQRGDDVRSKEVGTTQQGAWHSCGGTGVQGARSGSCAMVETGPD